MVDRFQNTKFVIEGDMNFRVGSMQINCHVHGIGLMGWIKTMTITLVVVLVKIKCVTQKEQRLLKFVREICLNC